jgi:hypothetical protein
MDRHPDTWTADGVKGGLIGFYREIAGVGLVFPRADRPIAVEFPGYPVVRLRPTSRRGGPHVYPTPCAWWEQAATLLICLKLQVIGRPASSARNAMYARWPQVQRAPSAEAQILSRRISIAP